MSDCSFTLFKSAFDNKTHRSTTMPWAKFAEFLEALSQEPGYKPSKGETGVKGSPLISPAVFTKDQLRRNVNVLYWGGWCAIDIDEYDGKKPSQIVDSFAKYENVIYSTASSTRKKPKFRIVLPLADNVPGPKIRHFWYALNKEFNSLADPQTKDLARMYYIPGQYPAALNFFLKNKGETLDAEALMEKHSDYAVQRHGFTSSMSEEMQKRIGEYRLSQMGNTQYRWSGWRDCKFVNRKLVDAYTAISGTGWYASMYKLMASIASRAVYAKYPITPMEIASLCREIDTENGSWYKGRPLETEAQRAISFALLNVK